MDDYSFTLGADDRPYAATLTGFDGCAPATIEFADESQSTRALSVNRLDGAVRSTLDNVPMEFSRGANTYRRMRQLNRFSLPGELCRYDLYRRVLLKSPGAKRGSGNDDVPQAPCSNGMRVRVIVAATAKNDFFAITVDPNHMIGVIVGVDLERGAPEWKVMDGTGGSSGCFIIRL